jgi:hypothetical protein
MSTTIYSHGSTDAARTEAPTVEVIVWPDYVVVKFKRSGFETGYFVHCEDGESIDALVGRVTHSLHPVVDFSAAVQP